MNAMIFNFTPSKGLCMSMVILYLWGFMTAAWAQTPVSGTVEDESGVLIPGVSFLVEGTTIRTVTYIDGKFEIRVQQGNSSLSFSFIGFEKQLVDISSRTSLRVIMREDSKSMEEVVVTALGVQRERKELGYTVQTLSSDEIIATQDNNFINALSGKIAGVQVSQSGSQIGASSRIVIRGNASFAGIQPLFVIDGVPMDNTSSDLAGAGELDYGNAIADIDP